MTDYAVNGGNYPTEHYGGHVVGNVRATFCERRDLRNPSANVLLIPNAPVSVLSAGPLKVNESFFGISVKRRSNDRFGVLTAKCRSSGAKSTPRTKKPLVRPVSCGEPLASDEMWTVYLLAWRSERHESE